MRSEMDKLVQIESQERLQRQQAALLDSEEAKKST